MTTNEHTALIGNRVRIHGHQSVYRIVSIEYENGEEIATIIRRGKTQKIPLGDLKNADEKN